MRRTNHLDITLHLVFDRGPGTKLNLRKPLDLAKSFDRADRDPEFTYIVGGPDASSASAVIFEMLGGVPHMSEAISGAQSTKHWKAGGSPRV